MNPMTHHDRHAWNNRLQTLLLVVVMLGICALAGGLLFGETGVWLSLTACLAVLLIAPAASARLTLMLYRAEPIPFESAPGLWRMIQTLAERSGLPTPPQLHSLPSPVVNAFAVGSRRNSAIALTDGLLRTLSPREIGGVVAHEMAHIAHNDLRVMGLADYVSRLTSMFSMVGQIMLLFALPMWVLGETVINWAALVVLVLSPYLALLAQLGLSRVREFDADRSAVQLTDDPEGLASALVKIEQITRSWQAWLMPGWGNPEPSWLRTHPATEERIRRLASLARPAPETWIDDSGSQYFNSAAPIRRPPRWYPGGFWR